MRDTRALAIILFASATIAGCGHLQHNDVLVFATDTKLALDVSTSAINGGTPSFTLGYKRTEGVWMPLVINGRQSTVLAGARTCGTAGACWDANPDALDAFKLCAEQEVGPPTECLRALSREVKYVGSDPGRSDTYSVFASFGADTGASGGGTAKLAQFFATGIAAQQLAANKNVEQALVAKDASSAQVDAANAAATAAKDERDAAFRALGVPGISGQTTIASGTVDSAMKCWRDRRADYRAAAAQSLAASNPDVVTALNKDDERDVRIGLSMLVTETADRDALNGVTQSVCTGG